MLSIWSHLFAWENLSSWIFIGWLEAILLAAVLAMIGIGVAVPNGGFWFLGAQACFGLSSLIFIFKVGEIAVVMHHPFWERAIFTFVLFGLVGIVTVEAVRGINRLRPPSVPLAEAPKVPELRPTPQPTRNEPKPEIQHNRSPSELAKEIAKELKNNQPQQPSIDPEFVKLRSDGASLIRRMYDTYKAFETDFMFWVDSPGHSEEARRLRDQTEVKLSNDYARFYKQSVNDIRNRLYGRLQTIPPARSGRDRETIYNPPGIGAENAMGAMSYEDIMSDLRILLNQLERENGLPLSCTDIKFHRE